MSVVVIVQARMNSSRLPGKVLKAVAGRPLLSYQLERLRRCKLVDRLVVATTTNKSDNPVEEVALSEGALVFRGDEQDVLSRYYKAAKEHDASVVVRLTADCPVIDPSVVDQAVALYQNSRGVSYVSNTLTRSYPRGMDCEVFSFSSLEIAVKEAGQPKSREHVTPFIHSHPTRFPQKQLVHEGEDLSHHRWTVDEEADFTLMRMILEALYPVNPEFTMQDVLTLLEKNAEWIGINAHITQKAH